MTASSNPRSDSGDNAARGGLDVIVLSLSVKGIETDAISRPLPDVYGGDAEGPVSVTDESTKAMRPSIGAVIDLRGPPGSPPNMAQRN
jgi:hypothetical protein